MIENELKQLREKINYHNRKYYDEDQPEISDYEFDMLMQQLKKIEAEHPELITTDSPTQIVGGHATFGTKVEHEIPLLSLNDVFDTVSVEKFVATVQKKFKDYQPEFIVEQKIDGLSIAIRYINGKFNRAITRGNGKIGEDVTANILQIQNLITKLSEPIPLFEIRGEVYLDKQTFEKINEQQQEMNQQLFKNPRNCAAGTLRQLDTKIVKDRNLSLFVFNLQESRGKIFETHVEAYEFMKNQGIPIIPDYKICRTTEEILKAIHEIEISRKNLPYEIDGAVVKLNRYSDRELLGKTSKVPKWAIAYKFPPEEKETVLRSIHWDVGRTGRVVPIAIFDPVDIAGSTISRATLNNQKFIVDMDLHVGDRIVVFKAGDIIPKIKEVVEHQLNAVKFEIPTVCPKCETELVLEKSFLICKNQKCPGKFVEQVIYFAARNAMNIRGLGESVVESLVANGFVKKIADLYRLKNHRQELIDARIVGIDKATDNLLNAIELSKKNNSERILISFGINGVGTSAATTLIENFGTIENISNATHEELLSVKDLGETTVESIKKFFADEENKTMLADLKNLGLNI